MKNDNTNKDINKSLEHYYSSTSSSSQKIFDSIDHIAKKGSDIKENYEESKQIDEEQRIIEEEKYSSRLKTNEEKSKVEEVFSQESNSRIKTNINNSTENTADNNKNQSRLKTAISKASNKVFKFKNNQGKISKTVTVVSKAGKVASKYGKVVSKGSRAIQTINDGTNNFDYIQKKAGEKVKKVGTKVLRKQTNKITKPLLGKIISAFKIVFIKLIKLLIGLISYLGVNIIPVLFVILALAIVSSIFGGGSSKSTIAKYESYMQNIQAQYDAEVDRFLRENPDGLVVGSRGNYGQINWKAPLSIIQGTGANIEFDREEQILLNKFKDAGLFEKHEIIEQSIKVDDKENSPEKKVKVLVITNPSLSDYLNWCKNNYNVIAQFTMKKKVGKLADKYFNSYQLEMINLLYNSNDFAEQFTNISFPNIVMGKVDTPANLNSEFYNSKNALANAGFKGQCTWYAYGRALETTGKKMPTGNAQTWITSAIAMGYQTGTEPSKNAVVVLSGGNYGHVAFVEEYTSEKLVISEGNIGNPCSKAEAHCSQKEYANNHFSELVRTTSYSSFGAYQEYNKRIGYSIIGFIYLN